MPIAFCLLPFPYCFLDISFLIVSWNVRELLRRALHSILADASAITPLTIQIIVVDNASHDGTAEMLRAEFPSVRVIVNADNRGFTRGNNQALAAATARDTSVAASGRYLFLLNPDTELVPGALRAMIEFMDAPENACVGILGPQLVYPDGSIQSSRRRFPTFATALLESTKLQQWLPRNGVLTRYYMGDTHKDDIQDVDWVVGAAMLVRRAVYDQIGGLDERFFMYSEELDWCYRAKQAGWRVVYFPRAQVRHYEGKSSEQVLAQRDIYFHSSKVRYFKKHHGVLKGELLRWFLLGMFAYQWLDEGAKWLMGHKRTLRAERVRAYGQVIKSGLK